LTSPERRYPQLSVWALRDFHVPIEGGIDVVRLLLSARDVDAASIDEP
jgi:hypothetical protein